MKKIIISIVCIIAVVAIVVTVFLTTRFQYNDKDAVGNTAGNLYNGGLFCEYNNKVYFSNPYDDNKLYVMDASGKNAEKLCEDRVSFINIAGEYIYYKRDNKKTSVDEIFNGVANGVFRLKIGDEVMNEIHRGRVDSLALSGNYLYYSGYDDNDIKLYKSKIDDTDNKALMDKNYKMLSISNGNFYFTETTGNHNILKMNIDTQVVTTFMQGNYYMPIVVDSYIYYIDVGAGYKLCRTNMSNRIVEVLSNDRVVNYNIGEKMDVIFYQVENGEDHKLMRMKLNGGNQEEIAKGDFFNISITSMYTYCFVKAIDEDIMYRVLTNGKDELKVFQPEMK